MDRQIKAIEEAKSRVKEYMENGWTDHELSIYIKGFVEGSDWSIETAYHQPGDIPLNGEMILCETKGFPMIAGPNHENFNETVEHFGITRWAYTNDLLPGVVPSPEKKDVNPKFRKGDLVVFKPLNECMELGNHYNIPFELKRVYKSFLFTVDGFELKHNHIFYTLKSPQFPPISTPECFLDLIGISLQVPEIKIAYPKYNRGQSVIIKSERELRLFYGEDADLTELIPYANQEVVIEDIIAVGYSFVYKIRQYKKKAITVAEDAILTEVRIPVNKDIQNFLKAYGLGELVATLPKYDLDTSKLNPSPMETWNEMFSGAKGFFSSASSELRAFAAG